MAFLSDILGRPSNERPFLVLVVGYPAADAQVPADHEEAAGRDRDVSLETTRGASGVAFGASG